MIPRKLQVVFVGFALLAVVVLAGEDFYKLLGLNKDADNREIRRAFKKLAIQFHPDKNKGDEKAHEKFVEINRAYEVLKDEELRKKYDLYGEEGVKEGGAGGQNYQSWHFYKDQFGIYDEDAEIITIGGGEFEQMVLNSGQRWFINFYSTHCSHCHELAPAWRKMARDVDGVIRIGAVNCLDDFMLCQQQGIYGYPSLIMYPEKHLYNGGRSTEQLIEFVMSQSTASVVELSSSNFEFLTQKAESASKPWLIDMFSDSDQNMAPLTRKKLAAQLENLVNVAHVDCGVESSLCSLIGFDSSVVFFPAAKVYKEEGKILSSLDAKEICTLVLEMLPDIEELTDKSFKKIVADITSGNANPWLVEFVGSETSKDIELRKLPALLVDADLKVGRINCSKFETLCVEELHIRKYPTFTVFKKTGGFEIHYGRQTAFDVASFARDSAATNVRVLGPDLFPGEVMSRDQTWFVDFFAPWCPPCMKLLPEFRKASKLIGDQVNFGTIDCTVHQELCKSVNVHSYPTTILYNQSVPHVFVGLHSSIELVDFVEDVKNPPIVALNPTTFDAQVTKREKGQIWVVDYFNPHCMPCQQLAPEFRKLAKMMAEYDFVHFGDVDCVQHAAFCQQQFIQGYPTVRLFPMSQGGGYTDYQSWFRDAGSLRQWIHYFLPSNVDELKSSDFFQTILIGETPWLLDFYAPWCGHCQVFAPEFEKVALKMNGKVKLGKINCDVQVDICQAAGIRGYPTLKFYAGAVSGVVDKQNPFGIDIQSQKAEEIVDTLNQLLKSSRHLGKNSEHDEL